MSYLWTRQNGFEDVCPTCQKVVFTYCEMTDAGTVICCCDCSTVLGRINSLFGPLREIIPNSPLSPDLTALLHNRMITACVAAETAFNRGDRDLFWILVSCIAAGLVKLGKVTDAAQLMRQRTIPGGEIMQTGAAVNHLIKLREKLQGVI